MNATWTAQHIYNSMSCKQSVGTICQRIVGLLTLQKQKPTVCVYALPFTVYIQEVLLQQMAFAFEGFHLRVTSSLQHKSWMYRLPVCHSPTLSICCVSFFFFFNFDWRCVAYIHLFIYLFVRKLRAWRALLMPYPLTWQHTNTRSYPLTIVRKWNEWTSKPIRWDQQICSFRQFHHA